VTAARLLPLALIVLASAGLGACSIGSGFSHDATEGFSVAKYGPAATRTVAYGTTVPKGGGHYMVGEPYRIAGKTYIPHEDPSYSQVGVASWYGSDFHGRETANGEIYDLDAVTAAHPTLPLPSYARVTNLENGRSITVRVNDRGPFADNRIIDVSRTVARKLDFEDAGTAKVKVDYIGPAPLEADDEPTLLASYRENGSAPAPANVAPVRVATVSAGPAPRSTPVVQPTIASPVVASAASNSAPAPRQSPVTPVSSTRDAIAPVITRVSTATSFAGPRSLSPAEEAADTLGRPDLGAQLALAAARRAAELGLRGPVAP
jgi:rare lipoprotein A